MNILVSCMGYDSGKSGISSYMRNVLANLSDCGHDITLLVDAGSETDFAGFKIISAPKIFSKSAAAFLWHIAATPFLAKSKKFDVLLILAANRRFAPFVRIPTVGVVHDLSQYRVSGKYDSLRMFYLRHLQSLLGRRLSRAAAISKSTLEDTAKFWRYPRERLFLDYNGLNPISASPDESIFGKLGIEKGKYIYYVSRIESPGKNHAGLIEAFEKLDPEIRRDCKLVFTGAKWSGADTVESLAKKSPLSDNIIFTGFVSDAELAALYRSAALFAFPSFSEGFGLPLIEAMNVGVPCACSKTSSLGEIGAGAAELFDPADSSDMARAIASILSNPLRAAELSQKGKIRAKDFDWKKHAQKLLDACHEEAGKFSRPEIFGVKFVNGRMRDVSQYLADCAAKGERKSVAFINTHYLNTAYEDGGQLERLKRFDLVLPDGSGVSLACRILGIRYRDNLNGTDLTPELCRLASDKNLSIYFLGGKPNVAKRATENLKKNFPKLKIAGFRDGYFSKDQEKSVIAEINSAAPDFLYVGFGVKLQEKWTLENRDRLDAPIVLAAGGVVDVYSGDLFRVSPFLRKLGLEWLGRLWQDPVRLFGRYVIGNPLFVMRVLRYKFFGMPRRKLPR